MGEMVKNRGFGEDLGAGGLNLGIGSSMTHSSITTPAQQGDVSGRQVVDEAKEVAVKVAEQAKQAVGEQVSRRAERSASDLEQVARALRGTKQELSGNMAAPYVDKAAEQLERLSDYLREANPSEIVQGAERFARREPLLFLGGAFLVGILGARFLKSSAHHDGVRAARRERPLPNSNRAKPEPGAGAFEARTIQTSGGYAGTGYSGAGYSATTGTTGAPRAAEGRGRPS